LGMVLPAIPLDVERVVVVRVVLLSVDRPADLTWLLVPDLPRLAADDLLLALTNLVPVAIPLPLQTGNEPAPFRAVDVR
jgi:hypothetical protein